MSHSAHVFTEFTSTRYTKYKYTKGSRHKETLGPVPFLPP